MIQVQVPAPERVRIIEVGHVAGRVRKDILRKGGTAGKKEQASAAESLPVPASLSLSGVCLSRSQPFLIHSLIVVAFPIEEAPDSPTASTISQRGSPVPASILSSSSPAPAPLNTSPLLPSTIASTSHTPATPNAIASSFVNSSPASLLSSPFNLPSSSHSPLAHNTSLPPSPLRELTSAGGQRWEGDWLVRKAREDLARIRELYPPKHACTLPRTSTHSRTRTH